MSRQEPVTIANGIVSGRNPKLCSKVDGAFDVANFDAKPRLNCDRVVLAQQKSQINSRSERVSGVEAYEFRPMAVFGTKTRESTE